MLASETVMAVDSGKARVTFVIPAHNAEATLAETLASVVAQTRRDWRAVIVDDGSTDATARLAETVTADSRVRLVYKPQGGVGSARNFGARLVETPWLVFLDADDLIAPDYVAEMLAAAETGTPDMVYCSGWRLAPDGRTSAMDRPPKSEHLQHLHSGNVFYIHTVMIARRRFAELGGFRETLRTCEDWELWIRLFRSGAKVAEVERLLTFYRMRPGSLTRDAATTLDCALTVIASAYTGAVSDTSAADLALRRRRSELTIRTWLYGVTAGAGRIDAAMLGPGADLQEFDSETFAGCVVHGATVGACQFYSDWPRLWPVLRDAIADSFTRYAGQCPTPFDAAPYLAKLAELALSEEPDRT